MRFGRLVVALLILAAAEPALVADGAGVGQGATVTAFGARGYIIQVAPLPPDPTKPVMTIDDVVRSINAVRGKAGLPPMQMNVQLSTAAQHQAVFMASIQRAIHTGPSGEVLSQRLAAIGFQWSASGEFVAGGFDDATAMVAAWMASPGHRDLLLGNFTFLGIGLERDREGMAYVSGIVANGF